MHLHAHARRRRMYIFQGIKKAQFISLIQDKGTAQTYARYPIPCLQTSTLPVSGKRKRKKDLTTRSINLHLGSVPNSKQAEENAKPLPPSEPGQVKATNQPSLQQVNAARLHPNSSPEPGQVAPSYLRTLNSKHPFIPLIDPSMHAYPSILQSSHNARLLRIFANWQFEPPSLAWLASKLHCLQDMHLTHRETTTTRTR